MTSTVGTLTNWARTAAVEVISDSEMVWHLNRPELWVPFYASDTVTDPLIYSLDYWETNGEDAYAQNPVGTGPVAPRQLPAGGEAGVRAGIRRTLAGQS